MENATQIALKKLEEVKIMIDECAIVKLTDAQKIVEQHEIDIINSQDLISLKANIIEVNRY